MIHPTSDVKSIKIGQNTNIWQFCVILPGATIGDNCNINSNVLIENDVTLGNFVTVKSGVQLWDGINIGNDVFIGPNVTFTNDKNPRSKMYPTGFGKIIVKNGASIGANSTILPNIEIGEYALIGAGSVVTKNVLPYQLVMGVPAKHVGWVNEKGEKLIKVDECLFKDEETGDLFDLTPEGISKRRFI